MAKKKSTTGSNQQNDNSASNPFDLDMKAFSDNLQQAMTEAASVMDPTKVLNHSLSLSKEWLSIWGQGSDRAINPKDWRFSDPTWRQHPVYQRWAQSYLAYVDEVNNFVESDSENQDWRTQEQLRFLADFVTSASAPSNTLLGNPVALKRFYETGGASLLQGMQHFFEDLNKNGGMPTQVDDSEFTVGKNLACTPGSVVYRNEMMELIHYKPTTEKVYKRPTLMICPPIGKYYFMDLAPQRSFVEYAVSEGIQFFTISWRKPHRRAGPLGF